MTLYVPGGAFQPAACQCRAAYLPALFQLLCVTCPASRVSPCRACACAAPLLGTRSRASFSSDTSLCYQFQVRLGQEVAAVLRRAAASPSGCETGEIAAREAQTALEELDSNLRSPIETDVAARLAGRNTASVVTNTVDGDSTPPRSAASVGPYGSSPGRPRAASGSVDGASPELDSRKSSAPSSAGVAVVHVADRAGAGVSVSGDAVVAPCPAGSPWAVGDAQCSTPPRSGTASAGAAAGGMSSGSARVRRNRGSSSASGISASSRGHWAPSFYYELVADYYVRPRYGAPVRGCRAPGCRRVDTTEALFVHLVHVACVSAQPRAVEWGTRLPSLEP